MRTHKAAAVIEATGVSPITLQRYMLKNIAFQPCDGVSRGSGDKRGYSTRRALQIAITFEASRLGIAPSRGAKAAFEFTDKGSPGRPIGEPYPMGTTLLVGLPGGQYKVVNVPPDLTIGDVLYNETSAFIINVNDVVRKVTEKLSKKNENSKS